MVHCSEFYRATHTHKKHKHVDLLLTKEKNHNKVRLIHTHSFNNNKKVKWNLLKQKILDQIICRFLMIRVTEDEGRKTNDHKWYLQIACSAHSLV